MTSAYNEAKKALQEGEVPIGAVIVQHDRIIGKGYNRVEALSDATAHAEIIAVSAASNNLESWRLQDCTLYVTLEPCLMCLGAILHARIGSLVYGARDPRFGAVESFLYRQEAQRSYGYFPAVTSGVLTEDCGELLSSFFKKIREKN